MTSSSQSVDIGRGGQIRTAGSTTTTQLPLALDGPARRDAALDALEQARAWWVEDAISAAFGCILVYGEVSADDIHRVTPVPAGIDPRVMGAVLNPRHFKLLRYTQSRRRVNHARRIAVWGAK